VHADRASGGGQWEVLQRAFDLIGAGDADGLADIYTEDYVLDLPYADGGTVIEGRDAALAFIDAAFQQVRFSFTITEVHPVAQPDLMILEYTGTGEIVATREPFSNRYIGLWWFRDGRISRTREYFDPTVLASGGA
jgi:ketosteroid isomerase-like protein